MRITRSALRRLIAEESARLLREAAFPEEIEAVYGEAPPEDGGGDGIPKILHVMYRGFRPVFIVTDVDANPLDEEDAQDVTQQIQPAKSNMTTPELAQAIIDFITDESNSIMYVFDEEMNDSETDDKFETGDYVDHLEGLIASSDEEAGTRGAEMYQRAGMSGEDEDLFEGEEELDEADKGPSPLEAAEGRLRAAIKDIHPTKASSLTKRVLDLIDDVMMEEAIAAEADGTDEFPFNASVKVLEQMGDTFPGDADLEELHAAIDAVIKPQWRGALQNAAEAESDRRDVEDTERDLSHPSRFLEEGDDDSDPDGGYVGFMASDEELDYLRGGGSYSDGPYADNDDRDAPEANRYERSRKKNPYPVDDIDSGYEDEDVFSDNLSEGRWAKLAGILKG